MAVRAEAGPYRAPAEEEALAPPKRLAKRSAAFMTLLALQFVAPGVVAALLMLLGEDFVALAPCAVAAFAMWCWGPLILARAADEIATERLVAIGALVVGGALLVPPVAHAIFLEVSRADDVRHRCAACPVVWMVLVYAVCTLIQAVLMLASVREYTQTRRPEDEDD